MKKLIVRSLTTIQIEEFEFVSVVNRLRKTYGDSKKNKSTLNLNDVVSKLKLFQQRDEKNSMLSFSLSYQNEEHMSCVRDFPNFGLNVKSYSKLSELNGKLSLDIDLALIPKSIKWQQQEFDECAEILSSENCTLKLMVTLDESTEWAGHSAHIATSLDAVGPSGPIGIPISYFLIEKND